MLQQIPLLRVKDGLEGIRLEVGDQGGSWSSIWVGKEGPGPGQGPWVLGNGDVDVQVCVERGGKEDPGSPGSWSRMMSHLRGGEGEGLVEGTEARLDIGV